MFHFTSFILLWLMLHAGYYYDFISYMRLRLFYKRSLDIRYWPQFTTEVTYYDVCLSWYKSRPPFYSFEPAEALQRVRVESAWWEYVLLRSFLALFSVKSLPQKHGDHPIFSRHECLHEPEDIPWHFVSRRCQGGYWYVYEGTLRAWHVSILGVYRAFRSCSTNNCCNNSFV